MKKIVSVLLALILAMSMFAFASAETVEEIIAQAQEMTLEELFQKAIEESNGKRFDAVGNSSRGKSVLPLFVARLQEIDPSYTLNGADDGVAERLGAASSHGRLQNVGASGHSASCNQHLGNEALTLGEALADDAHGFDHGVEDFLGIDALVQSLLYERTGFLPLTLHCFLAEIVEQCHGNPFHKNELLTALIAMVIKYIYYL